MKRHLRIVSGLAAAAMLLVGCSSDPNEESVGKTYADILRGMFSSGGGSGGGGVTEADIAASLGRTAVPLGLVTIEKRNTSALVALIETNGAYRTYATTDKQTIITRGGMVTGTRGLGGDLMSSDSTALLGLVSSRREGTAPYAMRFLTPENKIDLQIFSCAVEPGAPAPFSLGAIKTTGRIVTAKCAGPDGRFTNSFIVGNDGHILAARQYLGAVTGFLALQSVRR